MFGGSQLNHVIVHQHLIGVRVQPQVVQLKHGVAAFCPCAAAEQGGNPGAQLGQLKRLDQVVIGSGVQTGHDVISAAFRGQEKNRQGDKSRVPAKLPTDRNPIHFGHDNIQDEDVGG